MIRPLVLFVLLIAVGAINDAAAPGEEPDPQIQQLTKERDRARRNVRGWYVGFRVQQRGRRQWQARAQRLAFVVERVRGDSEAGQSAWAWYRSSATQCVANKEGGWASVSSDGRYAGRFQMDNDFEAAYGSSYQRQWGRANNWPAWAQVQAAYRGYRARGWNPWPNTARACGLL